MLGIPRPRLGYSREFPPQSVPAVDVSFKREEDPRDRGPDPYINLPLSSSEPAPGTRLHWNLSIFSGGMGGGSHAGDLTRPSLFAREGKMEQKKRKRRVSACDVQCPAEHPTPVWMWNWISSVAVCCSSGRLKTQNGKHKTHRHIFTSFTWEK